RRGEERRGADAPGGPTPEERHRCRDLERWRLGTVVQRGRAAIDHADQHRAREASAEVDPYKCPVGRLHAFADDVRQRRLETVHDDLFPGPVVVLRLQERVADVLEVDPAVDDARLLEPVIRSLPLRTPPDLFPTGVVELTKRSDRTRALDVEFIENL